MDFAFFEQQDGLVRRLYKNVENTAEIRKLIFSAKLPFTLVKPELIVDEFQLSVAVTKALYNMKEGTMTTRTLPTEIIYSLSPSKNISESLNQFSAQDGDKNILVLGDKLMFQKIHEQIKGEEVPLEEIGQFTDVELVKRIYHVGDEELLNSNLVDSVVSKMSSKDYAISTFSN